MRRFRTCFPFLLIVILILLAAAGLFFKNSRSGCVTPWRFDWFAGWNAERDPIGSAGWNTERDPNGDAGWNAEKNPNGNTGGMAEEKIWQNLQQPSGHTVQEPVSGTFLLRAEKEKLLVYAADRGSLCFDTHIPVTDFPVSEQKRLLLGIYFSDMEALYSYLESFSS